MDVAGLTDSCPSTLALERLEAGLLRGADAIRVRTHVTGCASCRTRLEQMDAEAAQYRRSAPAASARARLRRVERTRRVRWWAIGVAGVAVAAAIPVIAYRVPSSPPRRATALHARSAPVYLEPRGGDAPVRLRHVSLRGREVSFGEGVVEAAGERSQGPLVLRHTDVDGEVSGFVERVTVTQEFGNPFTEPIEAVYVFPLPENAAVEKMTLIIGERVIDDVVMSRQQARQTYEQARSVGRRAALLDQERPNVFTQSIANIQPGETVKVTLRYVAALKYDDGVFELNFPMVVGPRYVPGQVLAGLSQGTGQAPDTDRVDDASRISPPAAQRDGRDIAIRLRIDAGMPIEEMTSVSHRLVIERTSAAEVSLALDPSDRLPNKDLLLRWRVVGPELRSAILAHAGQRGGYFTLLVQPETESAQPAPVPRELVFLIDTSCSMTGAPLAAEKNAMRRALLGMNRDDTFELIDFGDTASAFSPRPLSNTPQNVDRALKYLDGLPANGGTNQLEGIRAALRMPHDLERVRMVLLLTDGFIGNEDEIYGATRFMLGETRIFSLGIGTSVNHAFLARLAELGRGFYQYVRPDEDSSEAIARFQRRISRPLLTDLTIDWGGLQVDEVLPRQVPDLFDHQALILVGKVRSPGKGIVRIRGRHGSTWRETSVRVEFPEHEERNGALASMWARARIEELERQQYGEERSEVARQIQSLGLEYHLVTKYTSFVAVDQERVERGDATVAVPTLTPDQTRGETGGEGKMGKHLTLIPKVPIADPDENGVERGKGGYYRTPGLGVGRYKGAPPAEEAESDAKSDDHETDNRNRRAAVAEPKGDDDEFAKTFGSGKSSKESDVTEPKKKSSAGYIPPEPGSGGEFPDQVSQSDIMQTIVSHKPEIVECVKKQKAKDPDSTGTLVIKFTILPNGSVSAVVIVTDEFKSSPIASCMAGLIKGWRFPKHRLPQDPITFPFKF